MHLSKEEILAAQDLPFEDISVPEWGEGAVVRVRSINGIDRDTYEMSLFEGQGADREANLVNIRGRLLVRCLVNQDGTRKFTDEDAPALGQKNGAVLDRLFEVARRLNRLSDKDIEDLGKPSASAPSAATTSASPNVSG